MKDVFEIARKHLGIKEFAGKESNPAIVDFFRSVVNEDISDEVPWCSAFVGHCLIEAGYRSSGKLNARSYLKWGKSSRNNPEIGDVVVFWRGSQTSWEGHVGFYAGEEGDFIKVLGGNQNNMVSIANYPKSRLLDIRKIGV